jgi:proton-translocating NADH-quinone oxidoreductase chain M
MVGQYFYILFVLSISGYLFLSVVLRRNKVIFYYNLIGSSIILSLIVWLLFYDGSNFLVFVNFLQFDGLTQSLVFLTAVLFPTLLIYSRGSNIFSLKFYFQLLLLMEILILLAFFVNHLLLFYFFYEALVIPMVLLIGLIGSRGRKIHAAFLFFFFTVVSSILLLLGLVLVYNIFGSFYYSDICLNNCLVGVIEQKIVCLLFFLGFASKIPIFPFHIWLPEAHVEAPTVGSVILAAIFLKFGFYGMVRTIIPVCSSFVKFELCPFFLTICLVSVIYGCCSAIRQIDLKKIIAYSSVVHMNIALLGTFVVSNIGLIGSKFLMVSHGFISSLMFLGIGMLYERFHIRNIMYFGGLVQFMPLFTIFFSFIMISNLSLPGTCNFIGEFFVFSSIMNEGFLVTIVGLVSIILVAVFSLLVLSRVNFYQLTGFLVNNLDDIKFDEILVFFVFCCFILILGIFPNSLLVVF